METINIALPWAHRLDSGGSWSIKSIVHTVKTQTGASLTHPAYDITKAYVLGNTVAVESVVYIAANAAPVGQAPWIAPALWTAQAVAKTDLYITLDNDNLADQWVEKGTIASYALVAGGVDDTSYRVEAMATFKDCDCREIQLWDCVQVNVGNCN
jgi:hypothetical protein